MTFPWLTPKRLALAGLLAAGAFLLWPRASDPALARAEANGYQAARRLPSLRRENAAKLRAYEAAKLATDEMSALTRKRLHNASRADTSYGPVTATALVSGTSAPIMGTVLTGDTLVPVRIVRVRMQEWVDTVDTMLGNVDAAIAVERGRASLAIASLQATVAAQDTVITGLRAELARKAPPWYRRAYQGIEALGVGVACGAGFYVVGGPLAGVGGAVLCAAIDGVRR